MIQAARHGQQVQSGQAKIFSGQVFSREIKKKQVKKNFKNFLGLTWPENFLTWPDHETARPRPS